MFFSPREVEVFAAVMRHGTATKAAESLDISQPAVSKSIAQFQRKAGFEVFRKERQRLVPTQEAHMLFAEVERSFVSVREIARAARDIRDLRTGRLNIGALPGMGLTLLPGAISRFIREHPTISVTLSVRASPTVIEWVGRNQIDLGIAVTAATENPAIVLRALPSVPGVCVIPANHRLAARDVVRVADLDGEEFVSFAPSDPLRLQLDALCGQGSIHRRMSIESPIASAVIGFVSNGAGIAIVDCISAWYSNWPNVVLRPFQPRIQIEMSIYRPRGTVASAVTNAFMEAFLRDMRDDLSLIEDSIAGLDGAILRPTVKNAIRR